MSKYDLSHFEQVAKAIRYINDNFKDQPDLDEVAKAVNLSPFHFQRLFTEWAGVSPKKFLQYISIGYAKRILREKQASLFDAAIETGLSGTGRLHDLFLGIEGMTPGEYKNGGESLTINYGLAKSPFGNIIIASTHKGICYLAFYEDDSAALEALKQNFPKAIYRQMQDDIQRSALVVFIDGWQSPGKVRLHLKGTAFQIKVWEALLKIPMGRLTTYGNIARDIRYPKASRAVGTAVGDNPVAFLIPCHRVIQSTGLIGQYHWGNVRKSAIIGWEAAQCGDADW